MMCGVVHFLEKLPWASSGSLYRQQKENGKRNPGHTVQFWAPELITTLSPGPTHQDGSWGWFWRGAQTTLGRSRRPGAQVFSPSLAVSTQASNDWKRVHPLPACLMVLLLSHGKRGNGHAGGRMPEQKCAEQPDLPVLPICRGIFYIVPGLELLPPIFCSFWCSRFGLKNLIHLSWVWMVSFSHVLLFFEMKAQDAAAHEGVCFRKQKEQKHTNSCLLSVWCLYMCTLWLCLSLFLREHWRSTSKSVTVDLTTSLNP